MAWDGEIQAATVDQLKAGRDGTIHIIDADAGGVVAGLKRIDENLCLRYSEAGNYYVVYYLGTDPETGQPQKQLVATYQTLDGRIVTDLERLNWENRQPGYSFADELDELDKKAEKEFNCKQREAIGESASRLAHAMRKDLGKNDYRAFISKDLGSEE